MSKTTTANAPGSRRIRSRRFAHKVNLLSIVTTSGARGQLRMPDQLHRDRAPRAVAQTICGAIANTIHRAEIAYDLLVDTFKIFQFPRLVDLVAAFSGQ